MPASVDVTVVVPAYQAEQWLADTLQTVALQTLQPVELIVVDDGSTDGTCCVVRSVVRAHPTLSVRLIRRPHRGPGAARNAGVRAAVTNWIAFLDSDDLWQADKLAVMTEAIAAHPEGNLFCHNETVKGLDGGLRVNNYESGFSRSKPVPRQLYQRNYFSTSAVVCRRDLVLRWGGFDEELTSAQDYELWLRMSPDLVPIFVPEVLGTYVLREGNITTGRFWRRLGNILRVKHRHRAKGGLALYAYSVFRALGSHLLAPLRAAKRRGPRYEPTPYQ